MGIREPAVLMASIIIIISIAAYATVASSGGESTFINCTYATSTFVSQEITAVIPSPGACITHKISLSGFSLIPSGSGTSNLRGTITIDTQSPVTGLMVYLNSTYELSSGVANSNATNYSIQYGAALSNVTVPVTAGNAYSVEIVALFQDGTATIASTLVSAA